MTSQSPSGFVRARRRGGGVGGPGRRAGLKLVPPQEAVTTQKQRTRSSSYEPWLVIFKPTRSQGKAPSEWWEEKDEERTGGRRVQDWNATRQALL